MTIAKPVSVQEVTTTAGCGRCGAQPKSFTEYLIRVRVTRSACISATAASKRGPPPETKPASVGGLFRWGNSTGYCFTRRPPDRSSAARRLRIEAMCPVVYPRCPKSNFGLSHQAITHGPCAGVGLRARRELAVELVVNHPCDASPVDATSAVPPGAGRQEAERADQQHGAW
jgi:hypothetical protein